jgi:DNA-binding CsgD family transcriptional regulator
MRQDVTIEHSVWKDKVVLVARRVDRDDLGTSQVLIVDESYELNPENIALMRALIEAQPVLPSRERLTEIPPVDELSYTERRVLRYLSTNLTRSNIARQLYVSVNTVSTHIRNIYSKLDANNRTQAVERARQLRLIAH